MKPYLEYVKNKKLNKGQIKVIESKVNKKSRLNSSKNFYTQIDDAVKEAIQSYFTYYFEKIERINLEKDEDFPIYMTLSNRYLDEFTLNLMREYILLKIKTNKGKGIKKYEEALYWMFHHDAGLKRVHIIMPRKLKIKMNKSSKR